MNEGEVVRRLTRAVEVIVAPVAEGEESNEEEKDR